MRIYRNTPLSQCTYYRIGGNADVLLEIVNASDLQEAISYAGINRIEDVLPLGLGSNLLISDKGFRGAVFRFINPQASSIEQDGSLIKAFASVSLDDLICALFEQEFVGLEWAGGLPSTVGGAVRGNVGAFGGDISHVFEKAEVYLLENSTWVKKTCDSNDMQFGYRTTSIKQQKNAIVANAWFRLKRGSSEDLERAKKEYEDHIAYRHAHHPMEYPSCGSVFKNIVVKEEVEKILEVWPDVEKLSIQKWHNKVAMGYVLSRLGFSGFQIGGAQVSTKHANYILNVDNEKFDDVISIIDKIKEKFSKTFGFSPELELEIVY